MLLRGGGGWRLYLMQDAISREKMTFLACKVPHPESEPPTNDTLGTTTNKSEAPQHEMQRIQRAWGWHLLYFLMQGELTGSQGIASWIWFTNILYIYIYILKNSFFEGSWFCRIILVREQCNLRVPRHALWEHSRLVSFSKQSHSYMLGAQWGGRGGGRDAHQGIGTK